MAIPAGYALELVVEKELTQVSTNMTHVGVEWTGAFSTNSVWEYNTGEKAFETAIVNASYEQENPFFCSVFYHEIFYRGAGPATKNFKVQASSPLRIEIRDLDEKRCLAIDANGNGSFGDKGDILYEDADMDMYPDLAFSETDDTRTIDLVVYSMGDKSDVGEREVEITLFIKEGDEWLPRAVDTLLMK
jgi:hypothetical protein